MKAKKLKIYRPTILQYRSVNIDLLTFTHESNKYAKKKKRKKKEKRNTEKFRRERNGIKKYAKLMTAFVR